MKEPVVMLAALLVVLPAVSSGATVNEFEGGATFAFADLAPPGFETVVNLTLPAESHVKKAVLNVASAPGNATFPGNPAGVVVSLDGSAIWAFNGQGFGAFGNQTVLSDNSSARRVDFGPGGGLNESRVRMMKKAVPSSASVTLNLTGNGSWVEKLNWTGSANYDNLGQSVADAGDVNGDGYADVIAGEPYYSDGGYQCGVARLYLGGPKMNATADQNFTTSTYSSAQIGYSVAGAGDVNRDGYDDLIVGAPNAYVSGYYGVGVVLIYFGGKAMDTSPDVVLRGQSSYDSFGYSVSGAGDVNRDGYDDVIVGAPYNDAGGAETGRAYLFLGGAPMDAVADYNLTGSAVYDNFGYSVSGAGDVNGDGFADIAVGTPSAGSYDNGQARLFFGAKNIIIGNYLELTGEANYDQFGASVSDAGDVNRDGYGDIIVGAPQHVVDGKYTGSAYLFLGGKFPDATADLTIPGENDNDYFGRAVSGTGDLDEDGYSDFMVGAPYAGGGGNQIGKAYVYLGGAQPDSVPELNFTGYAANDNFGLSVSGAGDVNSDGHPDFLVGAPYSDFNGYDQGRAYLFAWVPGILDPELVVGTRTVLSGKGYVNASKTVNCLQAVSDYLASAIPSGTDPFDNRYVDVPVVLKTRSEGRARMDNLSIVYDYETTAPDFGPGLEDYRSTNKAGADKSGNLAVPLKVTAASGGRLKLSSLNINYDDAPALLGPIPELLLDEDSANPELSDLHSYFQDDSDPAEALRFSLVSATNSSFVRLSIENERFLSADALTGEENDNWTGTVEVVVSCADHWGSRRVSDPFLIVVKNVNDAPFITSEPPTRAVAGQPYGYNVTAVDGDNDTLLFSLPAAPAGMAINSSGGSIAWTPSAGGEYAVTVRVGDGMLSSQQSFTVAVPNRPPRITSTPPANAFVGVPFVYNITAADDDNDTLAYSLLLPPEGMRLSAGALTWTPAATGAFPVSLQVSDGRDAAYQNFTLSVTQPNRAPRFTSTPPAQAAAEIPFVYEVRTADDDGDAVAVALTSGPPGMGLEATGRLSWTPAGAGNFTVVLTATDGKGGVAVQEFVLRSTPAIRPVAVVTFPSPGQVLEGKTELAGTATRGTHPVTKVEVRLDGGEWQAASGNESWRLPVDAARLKAGNHSLEVRAYDGTGYSDVARVEFFVEQAATPVGGGLSFMTLLIIIVVIIAVVAVAAAMAMRRKRTPVEAPPAQAAAPPPVPPAESAEPPAIPPATPLPPAEPPKPRPPEREFTP